MKTLHFYVLRQAIATLVMTVCVFAFVLLLGNVLREILALLVNRQASAWLIIKAIGLLLPWIMAYVLPFALLTAMLLLFGRMSADNELTAVKASGISLLALVMPLLIFALVMSGVCAWFNLKVTPESRIAYKQLLSTVQVNNISAFITEDRFIEEIPGIVLYVRNKRGDVLEDVYLGQLDKDGKTTKRTMAAKATVTWDWPAKEATFELFDGFSEQVERRDVPIYEAGPAFVPTNFLGTNFLGTLVTNAQPQRVIGYTRVSEWHHGAFGSMTFTVKLSDERKERPPRISDMTFFQLRDELTKRKRQGTTLTPVLVQMHRQVAFSFASFAFTLVAIPLGIRAHRRETSIGMVISLGLVGVYYTFLILSDALQMRERLHPHLIVWIPNILFQGLGIVLLWRANRKG